MVDEELKGFATSKKHGSIENLHSKLHINGGDTGSGRELNLSSIKRIGLYSSLDSQETQIRKLRESLEDWKEILLPVKSVLLWDNQWHPAAIVGGCTIFFTLLWLLDPSILSTVALFGLTLVISDYLVPILAKTMFKSETWTPTKEKQLEEICRSIVVYKAKILRSCESYYLLRSAKPKLYYGLTIATLALLAWVGNAFNNLFLTYVFVTVMLLVPGMEYHGVLHKYGIVISQKLSDFADDARSKMGQNKKEQ